MPLCAQQGPATSQQLQELLHLLLCITPSSARLTAMESGATENGKRFKGMNICCLPSLKHLGASTCTNIAFSKINDISCVSQLLSEHLDEEGCALLTMNRNSLGKDLHLPSGLTLQGTPGPCPVTNKNCQQNHSTQCRSITKEFTFPELCWSSQCDQNWRGWAVRW